VEEFSYSAFLLYIIPVVFLLVMTVISAVTLVTVWIKKRKR